MINTILVTRHSDELEKTVAYELNRTTTEHDIESLLESSEEISNSGVRTE